MRHCTLNERGCTEQHTTHRTSLIQIGSNRILYTALSEGRIEDSITAKVCRLVPLINPSDYSDMAELAR